MNDATEQGGERRNAILESAAKVFLRFGYRKTSMDDLARAAGLSRQGLYLHFKTKEELFQAAILKMMGDSRTAYCAALARTERSLLDRLLDAFEAFHGSSIGQVDDAYVSELLETAASLLGNTPEEYEQEFVDDVAELLASSSMGRRRGSDAITARDLAETLYATSFGLKHRVAKPDEYRKRMSVAVRAILGNEESPAVGIKERRTKRR